MATALTVYPSSLASSTNAVGGALPQTTGASNTVGNTTALGRATGWGEVCALGTTSAWASLASQGTPSGNGWFLDPTTLDNQTIIAGNWTPTLHMAGGSFTADLFVRAYIYTAGTYTLIGSMSLLSQNFTTTQKSYAFATTSLAAANFPTGSHLYIDVWLNVSSNASGVSATIKIRLSTSSTLGNAVTQLVTPGYQTTANSVTLAVTLAGVTTCTGTLVGTNPPGINLIQSAGGAVGAVDASSVTVSTLATGSNNLLLAFVTIVNSTPIITPPVGWSQIANTTNLGGSNGVVALYSKIASSGVTSFVFTFSAACNAAVAFQEWSGLVTANPLDQSVTYATVKQVQSLTGTTSPLANAGELAVWGLGFGAASALTYTQVANGYIEDSNSVAVSGESPKAQAVLFYNTGVGTTPTSSSAIKSGTGSTGSATILAVFIPGASGPLIAEFDGVGTLSGAPFSAQNLNAEVDGVGTFLPLLTVSTIAFLTSEVDAIGALLTTWFPVALAAEFDATAVLAWVLTTIWYNTKSLDGVGDTFGGLAATVPLTSICVGGSTLTAAPGYVGTLGVLFGTITSQGTLPGVLSASFTYMTTLYATRVLGGDVQIAQANTVTLDGVGGVQSAGLSLIVYLYS